MASDQDMEYCSRHSRHAGLKGYLKSYLTNNTHNHFEMVLYTVFCFSLPIILSHPQIIVGIAVNAMLVLAALNLKGYKLLPVIIAPSLGALSGALLFGPYTIFLLYLAPFIWIGNAILVFSVKIIRIRMKKNYWAALAAGSLLKSGFLFIAASLLYLLGIIPAVFLTAMGAMQLITALSGGAGAYVIQQARTRFF